MVPLARLNLADVRAKDEEMAIRSHFRVHPHPSIFTIEMHWRMKKFKLFSPHFLTGAFAKGRVVVS